MRDVVPLLGAVSKVMLGRSVTLSMDKLFPIVFGSLGFRFDVSSGHAGREFKNKLHMHQWKLVEIWEAVL